MQEKNGVLDNGLYNALRNYFFDRWRLTHATERPLKESVTTKTTVFRPFTWGKRNEIPKKGVRTPKSLFFSLLRLVQRLAAPHPKLIQSF